MAVVSCKITRILQLGVLVGLVIRGNGTYTHTRGHPLFVGKRTGLEGEVVQNCSTDKQCPATSCCVLHAGHDVTSGVCLNPGGAGQLCLMTSSDVTLLDLLAGVAGAVRCHSCQSGLSCRALRGERWPRVGVCVPGVNKGLKYYSKSVKARKTPIA